MEDMDEEQANAVEQAFELDYDVAQAFCSHIVPKSVLLFTGEALDTGMDFESEDGEGDEKCEGGDEEGREETGSPFPDSVKTIGE